MQELQREIEQQKKERVAKEEEKRWRRRVAEDLVREERIFRESREREARRAEAGRRAAAAEEEKLRRSVDEARRKALANRHVETPSPPLLLSGTFEVVTPLEPRCRGASISPTPRTPYSSRISGVVGVSQRPLLPCRRVLGSAILE